MKNSLTCTVLLATLSGFQQSSEVSSIDSPFLIERSFNLINSREIPLPEHPRPDFMRPQWENLNGTWEFEFDDSDRGIQEGWAAGRVEFGKNIMVPFPWGSRLSGVEDGADIGWYRRTISINEDWEGQRIFLTIGASDWETTVWLDGKLLGTHRGGYVPFSFELSEMARFGKEQELVIRVDDARRDFTLYGKQGYGNVRGIWQTIYLEARGKEYLETLHFTPDIDQQKVTITACLPELYQNELPFEYTISTPEGSITGSHTFPARTDKESFDVAIPDPRLWELDDPYLYEVEARLGEDTLKSYFGMRKISVMDLPGSDYPYIALNNRPVYMQLTLDQSYHPDGFYTFPSDRFIQDEIMRSKSIGLTGIRTHIKVEVPRKLYWADKLGLLVMEDLPNSWGEPDARMQAESEYTMKEMIRRDYNHPSIFSWVLFNETWGLYSTTGKDRQGNPVREYTKATQFWVASMYYLAKSLDGTRLVEDNSICCGRGHTETDVNSWHTYLPGWEWDEFLKDQVAHTYEGSTFNFEEGFRQGRQPNINSECGNVWGYDGSTGDVDWSWDYHRMINTFRKYPKIGGWLYTEHHDVINEWNGYWRFDRSEKETGLGEIMEGMRINDLHSPVYLSTGNEICRTVRGGEKVEVPLILSSMTSGEIGPAVVLSYELTVTNAIGEEMEGGSGHMEVAYAPWMQKELEPLSLEIPDVAGLAVLKLTLSDIQGNVLHRNFMHFEILSDQKLPGMEVFTVPASSFSSGSWSLKQWEVLDGKKVNGAGEGFFQYEIPVPEGTASKGWKEAYFLVEVSAKQLYVKDMEDYEKNRDFMLGSRVDPSANPNAYPMTDQTTFPSAIAVSVGGEQVYSGVLPDDPADHRGVLSWHHQLKDKKLREAGSYGYLIRVPLKKKMVREAIEKGVLQVRIETEGEGGIAVYGKEFGRYPVDPSLVLKMQ
jgi:hypothetical protein